MFEPIGLHRCNRTEHQVASEALRPLFSQLLPISLGKLRISYGRTFANKQSIHNDLLVRTPLECNKFQLTFYAITHSYLHVFSMSAPYVRENPISRSQIRAVQVYRFGGGYITIDCWRRVQILCIETQYNV